MIVIGRNLMIELLCIINDVHVVHLTYIYNILKFPKWQMDQQENIQIPTLNMARDEVPS